MELRDYQLDAVYRVSNVLRSSKSVLVCAPTGSGKTCIGSALLEGKTHPVWLCHRKDLLWQANDRVGHLTEIESIPTLAKHKQTDLSVDLVVVDEAHHSTADSWKDTLELFPNAKIVGLTATPERADGAPLGDIYQELVVATSYSHLLSRGLIVPCLVYAPKETLHKGLAKDPLKAYLAYAKGRCGFCFVSTVKQAVKVAADFNAAGYKAAVISAKTKREEREALLQALADRSLTMLVNCTTMTEGIDCPSADVCILARRCAHSGLYLQIVGRVLRACEGKQDAMLLDLTGAVHRHGLPTQDREYSLSGTGIKQAQKTVLRTCYDCGAVMENTHLTCILCNTRFYPGVHKPPKVLSLELQQVYAGSETPWGHKIEELQRLVKKNRWPGAAKRFEELFGSRPTPTDWVLLPQSDVRREYDALASKYGYDKASTIIKSYTGQWPPYRWRYENSTTTG